MKNYLFPDYKLNNIFDLDPRKLKGFKYVFFDLDNTLGSPYDLYPDNNVIKLINMIKEDHIVYLISNNTNERVIRFNSELKVNYMAEVKKPQTKRFKQLLKVYGINPKDVIYIGDQVMTDVLVSKRLGFKVILVKPLTNTDELITFFPRLLDKFFRLFMFKVEEF